MKTNSQDCATKWKWHAYQSMFSYDHFSACLVKEQQMLHFLSLFIKIGEGWRTEWYIVVDGKIKWSCSDDCKGVHSASGEHMVYN